MQKVRRFVPLWQGVTRYRSFITTTHTQQHKHQPKLFSSFISLHQQTATNIKSLSEDAKSDMLASIDHVKRIWNDGSSDKAIKFAKEELTTIQSIIDGKQYVNDVRGTQFLLSNRFKLNDQLANMFLITNQYGEALEIYRDLIKASEQEYESFDKDQKRYNRAQYLRDRVQLVLRAAECLRHTKQFDESVKVLLQLCDEVSEEPMLLIYIRERLGWSYSQIASDAASNIMQVSDKAKRFMITEEAQSNFRQAIHHLDVAAALSKQIGIEDNYIEFTSDDVRSVVDVLFARGLCYKDLASLEPTREESDKLYKLAIADFIEVTKKQPKYYAAYFNCADCCAKIREHGMAVGFYDFFMNNFQEYVKEMRARGDNVTRIEELYIETRLKRAVCTINNEDFPMAQDELKELVILIEDLLGHQEGSRLNRDRLIRYKAIAHNKLGYCYYRRYNYAEGIAENTKAIQIDPTMMEAFRDRCECYECLSFETEAAEDRRMVEYLKRKIAMSQ